MSIVAEKYIALTIVLILLLLLQFIKVLQLIIICLKFRILLQYIAIVLRSTTATFITAFLSFSP